MRRRRASIVLVAAGLAFGVAACSDSSEGGAPSYTPAPTNVDIGPNDTSQAPQTVQGVLRLDGASGCMALETDSGRLALSFTEYELSDGPALVATEDDREIAGDGDTVVLSGFPGTEPADACGSPFTVDSFNSVTATAP